MRTDTSASMVLPTRSGITNMINKLKKKDDPPPLAPMITITNVGDSVEFKKDNIYKKTYHQNPLISIDVIRQRLKMKKDESNIEDILNYVIA